MKKIAVAGILLSLLAFSHHAFSAASAGANETGDRTEKPEPTRSHYILRGPTDVTLGEECYYYIFDNIYPTDRGWVLPPQARLVKGSVNSGDVTVVWEEIGEFTLQYLYEVGGVSVKVKVSYGGGIIIDP